VLALPDRHGFRGTRSDGAPRSFAGRTSFCGVIACVPLPCARVAAWLPAGVELAPPVTSRDDHPIVLLFGEQRQPELLRAGLALPMGASYGEFGVFVPCVGPSAAAISHLRLPHVVDLLPGRVGRQQPVLRQGLGDCALDRRRLRRAADRTGQPLLHAVVAGAGAWDQVRRESPRARRDPRRLRAPGARATGGSPLGRVLLRLGLRRRERRPVRASIWIDGRSWRRARTCSSPPPPTRSRCAT
jgi:hypothetical protein